MLGGGKVVLGNRDPPLRGVPNPQEEALSRVPSLGPEVYRVVGRFFPLPKSVTNALG